MFIPDEKMKVNRFRVVAIPRNSEFYKRFGDTVAASNSYTGDDLAPLPQNKIDTISQAEFEAYDMMRQQEAQSAGDGDNN